MIRRLAFLSFLTSAALFATNPDGTCNITTAGALPQAVRASAVSYTIATTGCGSPMRSAQIATGALPAGLTLTSTATGATISGTPTASGTFTFAVRFVDVNYKIPSKSFVIKVNPPLTIDTLALATGSNTSAYSDTVRVHGGVAPYTFTVVEGTIPSGLGLNSSTGVISGTMPLTGGQFRIRVTDSASTPNTAESPYEISNGARFTTVADPPVASIGSPYTFDLDSTGGATGFTLALGQLPPGLNIDTNGTITGTPTTAGDYHFTISQFTLAWRSYHILVNGTGSVTGTPRDAEESFAYDHSFSATGGVFPYTFAVTAGSLPAGITLDSASGALLGELPIGAAGSSFTITATDTSGRTYSQGFTITRAFKLTGTPGTPATARAFTSGSASPYVLTQGSGTKSFLKVGGPDGGSFVVDSATGTATYNFFTSGAFTPVVLGTDALGGGVIFSTVTYTVVGALKLTSPFELQNGRVGIAYGDTIAVENGNFTPLTFSIATGTFPPGLNLNASTGVISGTPLASAGNNFYVFGITVTDSAGQTDNRSYFIGIGGFNITGSMRIDTTNPPHGTLNVTYPNVTLIQSGSSTPIWTLFSGNLPTGLGLSSGGIISGTPTALGSFTFQVRLSEVSTAGTRIDTKQYTIIISNPMTGSTVPASPLNTTTGSSIFVEVNPTGGRAPYTLSLNSGQLPDGVFFQQEGSTAISGTPQVPGTYSFDILLTDADVRRVVIPYQIIVRDRVRVLTTTLPAGTTGVAYATTLQATGGTGTYTWSPGSGGPPPGLTVQSNGQITGTPTTPGSYTFAIAVQDSLGNSGGEAFLSIDIADPIVITNSVPLPPGTLSNSYSTPITTTGGATLKTYSISSGNLNPLIVINPGTGVVAGPALVAGTYSFTVRVVDDAGRVATKAEQLTVLAPTGISPATLPNGTINTAYSQQLTMVGGISPVSWTIISGSLPAGMNLGSATGLLSGTPTASGLFNFIVNATDTQSQSAQASYSLRILNVLTISPAALPDATVAIAYSQALTATGANLPVTWSVTTGSPPAGITLNTSTGVLSGTPAAAGTSNFTVLATDSLGQTGQRAYALLVAASGFAITTASPLPDGFENDSYTVPLATNSSTPSSVSWAVVAGSLPPGLTLGTTTGNITGAPTLRGAYSFTVEASMPFTGGVALATLRTQKAFTVTIQEGLRIVTGILSEAVQNKSYSALLVGAGGRPPYSWQIVGGTLPAGLVLNASTGVISGTTSVAEGSYPQVVRLTDSRTVSVQRTLSFSVVAPPPPSLSISPDTLPNGRVNQAYSAGFSGSGGTPGYTFGLAGGSLPPGLVLSGSSLSGTPSADGTFRFTINVTDSAGRVAGNAYSVVIEPALTPLSVTPSSIAPTAQVGQPFSQQFGATGGKAPYTFAISGNTPPGTSSNSAGLLSGTPSTGGTFTFSVEVTDSLSQKASRSYTITITGGLTITTTPPLPDGTVAKAYELTFGASGGKPPYSWTFTGEVPPGMSFDSASARFAGTPAAPGSYPFTLEVRDSLRASAQASFTLVVFDKLEITNSPADMLIPAGQPFTFTFATKGGKPPVTLSIASGALPGGLSMSGGGAVTGTPNTAGTFAFTVQAKDALGNEATRAATLRVGAPLTVTTASLPSGTVGTAYSSSVAATGGVPPLGNWSVSAGSLPAGLSLAAGGSISGTPTSAGTSSFTVRITDSAGTAATRALSITVNLPAVPPVNILGLPQTLPPGAQTNITIQLATPFPATVTGTLTLIFEPNAVNNADDPSVQFSSGGRTVTFTIPANQTNGTFPVSPLRLLSGTVAGNIRIRTTTEPASATPVPDTVVPIARSIPVITAGTAQLGSGTFTLVIDGFSNTREISSATFRLTPTAGASLQTTDVPVAVAAAYTAWYQSTASAPFGGQFRLTLPFNVSGSLNDIDTVIVTVTNAVGTSQPFTIRLR
ncbi:MAG: putative Ig domain-containing protein [Acidobacteria bacterium]|nr:putative Ig domain-containing protein [Acidobacteriota bacterium]